jgi:hypothetical protein
MLDRDWFAPLGDVIADIKLAFLRAAVALHPDETVRLASPVEAVDVPPDAEEISIEIHYTDPNGTEYEPLKHAVRVVNDQAGTGTERVPIDLRVTGE